LAACFPGRRRHDLEALVAYTAYKRRSPEGSERPELEDEILESVPLEASRAPAPNLEPGDALVLPDGREAIVTARIETNVGPLAAYWTLSPRPQRSRTPIVRDDSSYGGWRVAWRPLLRFRRRGHLGEGPR
jgi:hypothetical protein